MLLLLECGQEGHWGACWYQYWAPCDSTLCTLQCDSTVHVTTMSTIQYWPGVGVCKQCSTVWYWCLSIMWYCVVWVSQKCGTVWYGIPCWYQYWVLRGDSHGHWEGSPASQRILIGKMRKRSLVDIKRSSCLVLVTGVEPELFSNIWGKGNNIVVSFL